jgi:hypothetical protein
MSASWLSVGLVSVFALGACLQPKPTQAVVAQLSRTVDGTQFRGCTMNNLAWTLKDRLIDNCGEPDLGLSLPQCGGRPSPRRIAEASIHLLSVPWLLPLWRDDGACRAGSRPVLD